MLWKKSMQVVHTAAVPPNQGRIRRAISGCTRKSRNADSRITTACSTAALSVDFGRVRFFQHPGGDRVHGLGFLAEEAVRGQRIARTAFRGLAAFHRDQRMD